jgi:hypothetical protein
VYERAAAASCVYVAYMMEKRNVTIWKDEGSDDVKERRLG